MKTKLILACCLVLTLTSCPTPHFIEQREKTVKNITDYGDGRLYTIEHDQHLFIVEGRSGEGGVIHHPGCPCGKP